MLPSEPYPDPESPVPPKVVELQVAELQVAELQVAESPVQPNVVEEPDSESEAGEEVDALGWAGPSRSQVKREAEAVSKLGQKLTELSLGELQHLPISAEVLEAVEVWRKLKRGAQGRQLRRIGSLLRDTDIAPIAEAIGRGPGPSPQEKQLEQLGELWRTRLLDGGDEAVETFLAKYPGGDRRELRQLVRASRGNPTGDRIKRARRDLLRRVRDLLRQVAP